MREQERWVGRTQKARWHNIEFKKVKCRIDEGRIDKGRIKKGWEEINLYYHHQIQPIMVGHAIS